MALQSERYEEQAQYGGGDADALPLVRTVVAMSNSEGGQILIWRLLTEAREAAAAALERRANAYVAPAIHGLETEPLLHDSLLVRVSQSRSRPHVLTRAGTFTEPGGRTVSVFHEGQVWVRHGGGDRLASAEDLHRMVRDAASEMLQRMSTTIAAPTPGALELSQLAGIPVRLSDELNAVPVDPDLGRLYPYTTRTLAEEVGKSANWVAAAVKLLHLKERREHAYGVTAPGGVVIQWRYSEKTRQALIEMLERNPGWNPYRA